MQWTQDAEAALSRVPFFVRRRVRKRIEEEAAQNGASVVRMEHVTACRQRFLQNMEHEVKGYELETCFGAAGCRNRVAATDDLVREIEKLLVSKDLRGMLKARVQGPLKMHHEFRVCLSDCANACSRPQITDIGLIAAVQPALSDAPCTLCNACVETCQEQAIRVVDSSDRPVIDPDRCVLCGQCIPVCPSGTLIRGSDGFRILLGGKLGRHPQLGREIPGLCSEAQVLETIGRSLDYYAEHCVQGERFGEILNRVNWGFLENGCVCGK